MTVARENWHHVVIEENRGANTIAEMSLRVAAFYFEYVNLYPLPFSACCRLFFCMNNKPGGCNNDSGDGGVGIKRRRFAVVRG